MSMRVIGPSWRDAKFSECKKTNLVVTKAKLKEVQESLDENWADLAETMIKLERKKPIIQ